MNRVSVGGGIWPAADASLDELEWTLRYGTPSRADVLDAASVLAAYRQMVGSNERTRAVTVRVLCAARKVKP